MKKGSIIFKQCIKKISFVLVLILTMGIWFLYEKTR